MTIIDRSIDSIRPYERNPRKNGPAVDAVAASISEFGFKVPIVVDADGVIVAGHTRYKAAQKLGMETVPCLIADDLTPEQIKAFRLADNKTAELAEWDLDLLDLELADIDLDMSQFGFDLGDDDPVEVVEDDYEPVLPEEPKTKPGDIYQLGRHRLMCGDSTDGDAVGRLMDGVKGKLLLTDPPYGIDVVQNRQVGGSSALHFGGKVGKRVESSTYIPIANDDTTDAARANYDVALSCTDNQIIFGGNYFTDFLPPSGCWIVWDKQNTGNFADAELAWTSFGKGVRLYHFMWNGLCREGSREVEGKTRVHPTQKPVGMLADILKDFSKKMIVFLIVSAAAVAH